MRDIRHIGELVNELLITSPETRNSDDLLYIMVCKRLANIENLNFETAILNQRQLGLPKYASVSRSRRLAQQRNKDLRADKAVEDLRYENYKAVKEYVASET